MMLGFFNPMFVAGASGGALPFGPFGTPTAGGSSTTRVTSTTVTFPTDRPSGSVAVLIFGTENSGTITTPSGWTLKSSTLQGAVRVAVFTRAVDGSESSTFNVATGGARTSWVCGIVASANASTEVGTAAGGSSTGPNPPSLAPSWGSSQTMFVAIAGVLDDTGSFTAIPSGYAAWMTYDGGSSTFNNAIFSVCYQVMPGAAEDPAAFTFSPSSSWVAQTLAIKEGP